MGAPRAVNVGDITIGAGRPLAFIMGPCVIEDEALTLDIAQYLKALSDENKIPFIFKASFDKANRSSGDSFRGPGMAHGLKILSRVKAKTALPLITDVHQVDQVAPVAEVADILQIPALLSRQTDLLTAAARTGKPVHLKKGQFMSPWEMQNAANKIEDTGNFQILLGERGTCFGYNNLVVDMRSLCIMRSLGYPVVFDATHAVQLPAGAGKSSGGQREFVAPLSRAAAATGIDAMFWEVHPEPAKARCDGPNSLVLSELKDLIDKIRRIDSLVKKNTTQNN
jgi:2-dehydro-3-deoxyphosphooctonate aldolase (KDO 8-P synthase)